MNRDRLLLWCLRVCAVLSGTVLLLIVAFVLREAWPALERIGWPRFFTDPSWHPAAVAARGRYDLTPMLVGTLAVVVGGVLIATPLGVLSAVFCREYAPPRLAQTYRRIIELLAGIPSVVYGFWGLVVLVPLIRQLHPPGPSLLAGALILALMILPTIALLADAALARLPVAYQRGAAALGLSRWRWVWSVAVPAARPGLYGAVCLATARAVGETMAVLMVCGNVVQVPDSVFDPIRALTANIALEMAYAAGDHRAALFVSGLLLLGLIIALAVVADRVAEAPRHA